MLKHSLATRNIARKAHTGLTGKLRSGIRGHDEDDVAEIGLAALVISKAGIVHHLQQDVVDILMSLLNLVEQQHAVRRLADGIGKQSAVFITHISCWRANELGHGMFLGILAHIEAQQLDAQLFGQNTGHLGFTYTRRTHKEQRCQRLVIVEKTGLRHLYRLYHLANGFVLSIDLRE